MPDLKRVLLASATVLLAAIASGQTVSPFRVPRPMPPDINPGNGAPALSPPGQLFLTELDNEQMRVRRFIMPRSEQWWLPLEVLAPGVLLVALADSDLEITDASGRHRVHLNAGLTKWIVGGGRVGLKNVGSGPRQFLAIETKR
jgi:hypothetical protein